jgi:hypothetical protein
MTNDDLQQIRTVVKAEIETAISAAEARSQEFARNIETNLLTAFQSYAKGQGARLHTTETAAQDMAIRITALEERVLNIETRRPLRLAGISGSGLHFGDLLVVPHGV